MNGTKILLKSLSKNILIREPNTEIQIVIQITLSKELNQVI